MAGILATRLLLSRRDLKWNQADLSQRSGVSPQYISDLERDRITNPGVEVIHALATALGIRPEYLLGWTEDPLGETTDATEDQLHVIYDPETPAEYQLVQELLEELRDLSPDDQRLALIIIRDIRRSRGGPRVVGDP